MGNSASDRYQEGCEETRREDSQSQQGRLFKSKRTGTQYPARPGEKQYEWEEPRVVADSKCQHRWRKPEEKQSGKSSGAPSANSDRSDSGNETESELGRTTDAWGGLRWVDPIANRVDRLRLLGNGVVPGTCERAIRILLEKIHD